MFKILKGDEVIVLTGQDKNKIGKVISFAKNRSKVIVSGINVKKKSISKTEQKNKGSESGFRKVELAIDMSNIAIYNREDEIKDKVIFSDDEKKEGKKVRLYKTNKKQIKND
jgi:large subunit ribosomal protein L24